MRTRFWTALGTGALIVGSCEPAPPPIDEERPAGEAAIEVHAVLTEWGIELDRMEVPAGEVTFHIRNAGQYEHVFEVERGEEEWETGRIPPGGETVLTAELSPGTYEVYCPLDDQYGDHHALGMETSLTVR